MWADGYYRHLPANYPLYTNNERAVKITHRMTGSFIHLLPRLGKLSIVAQLVGYQAMVTDQLGNNQSITIEW